VIVAYSRGLCAVYEQAGAASLIFQALVLAMAVTVYLSSPFGQNGSLILFLFLTVSANLLSETFFVCVAGKDTIHYNYLFQHYPTEMYYGPPPFCREARTYRSGG
jgi:hypothetical protein